MAMTKAEKQYLEDVLTQFALRHTQEVLPDVPPPPCGSPFGALTKGFLYNSYNQQITKACSSSLYHNFNSDEKTNAQGEKWLFSTKILALKAMRYEMEQKFARQLRIVDIMIEEAEKEDA